MTARRVLFLDVETAPLLAHVWQAKVEWVRPEMMVEDRSETYLLTWSAKWGGDERVKSMRLTAAEARRQDDSRIAGGLAALVRQADVIVAHNLNRFDLPVLNARLVIGGLEPVPPVTTIDTLQWAKSNFKFTYNDLNTLGQVLGVGEKVKHPGFVMWRTAYMGDVAALKKMEAYNRGDVVLLEAVFDRLLPYVRRVPRLYHAHADQCVYCGSTRLQRRGLTSTAVHTYQRWQCQGCRRYMRSRTSEGTPRPSFAPVG
jgi:hypothetical protein